MICIQEEFICTILCSASCHFFLHASPTAEARKVERMSVLVNSEVHVIYSCIMFIYVLDSSYCDLVLLILVLL
jgi:hypothetical protein